MTIESLSAACGIGSAAAWGAGDFSGGLASRKNDELTVVLYSQVIGALFLAGLVVVSAERTPPLSALVLGAVGGACGIMGLVALYRAFARGRMGVAAPVSAVVTAVMPIVFTFIHKGLPETIQIIGFGLALAAVWLISHVKGEAKLNTEELVLPLVAGVGFGIYFTFLGLAATESVTWPLLTARMASLTIVFIVYTVRKKSAPPTRQQLPLIVLTGVLDAGGNALFALAANLGRLDITAALSSLYPAVTVMLAWSILKEKLVSYTSIILLLWILKVMMFFIIWTGGITLMMTGLDLIIQGSQLILLMYGMSKAIIPSGQK